MMKNGIYHWYKKRILDHNTGNGLKKLTKIPIINFDLNIRERNDFQIAVWLENTMEWRFKPLWSPKAQQWV